MDYDEFRLASKIVLSHLDNRVVNCTETNIYQALSHLKPSYETKYSGFERDLPTIYRCDLSKSWLSHHGLPVSMSEHALISGGVRWSLNKIFQNLPADQVMIYLPSDVYPVYQDLARKAGHDYQEYPTLPVPAFPSEVIGDNKTEFLLIANPMKPLGKGLTERDVYALNMWANSKPNRTVIIDGVYDLGMTMHSASKILIAGIRTIYLSSISKSNLYPATFGVCLVSPTTPFFQDIREAFVKDKISQSQLRIGQASLEDRNKSARTIAAELNSRRSVLLDVLSDDLRRHANKSDPDSYMFTLPIDYMTLLKDYHIFAIPASVFGSKTWNGSILTTLSKDFAR